MDFRSRWEREKKELCQKMEILEAEIKVKVREQSAFEKELKNEKERWKAETEDLRRENQELKVRE